jgi:hypothetical protein
MKFWLTVIYDRLHGTYNIKIIYKTELWLDSWQEQEIFLFSQVSRLVLGPTLIFKRHREISPEGSVA